MKRLLQCLAARGFGAGSKLWPSCEMPFDTRNDHSGMIHLIDAPIVCRTGTQGWDKTCVVLAGTYEGQRTGIGSEVHSMGVNVKCRRPVEDGRGFRYIRGVVARNRIGGLGLIQQTNPFKWNPGYALVSWGEEFVGTVDIPWVGIQHIVRQ